MTQAEKAELLRALHNGPSPLLIGNAWDAASARVFETAGFRVIGTSSAGVAYSLGYPDGQQISRREMLDAVERIARVVSVPVTADMEAGYGRTVDDAAATAREVIEAGAVGLNIEDYDSSLIAVDIQTARIEAIRRSADALGVRIVINARTDIFLANVGPAETRYARCLERLKLYREAGADCLFAPGVRDAGTIGKLVRELQAPLNVLAVEGTPSLPELTRLGVARVSVGSGPMRATVGLLQRIADEILQRGTFSMMTQGAIPYADLNTMMAAKQQA
jgi:2-methylisocitrate lyase-like PEP mutase family enzyme